MTFDTRIDPMLPRNAIYARAAWDHLTFANTHERESNRCRSARATSVCRTNRVDGSRAVAGIRLTRFLPYLRPLLGGIANLRGFRAGSAAADTLVGGSAELRVPVTSPLEIRQSWASVRFSIQRPCTIKDSMCVISISNAGPAAASGFPRHSSGSTCMSRMDSAARQERSSRLLSRSDPSSL